MGDGYIDDSLLHLKDKLNENARMDLIKEKNFTAIFEEQIKLNKIYEEKIEHFNRKKIEIEQKYNILSAELNSIKNGGHSLQNNNLLFLNNPNPTEVEVLKTKIDTATLQALVLPLEFEQANLINKNKELQYSLDVLTDIKAQIAPPKSSNLTEISKKYNINLSEILEKPNETNKILLDLVRIIENKNYELNMCCNVLMKQNYILKDQKEATEKELQKSIKNLNKEMQKHNELRETWKNANEQFIMQSISMNEELNDLKKKLYLTETNLSSPSIIKSLDNSLNSNTSFGIESLKYTEEEYKKIETEKKNLIKELNKQKMDNGRLNVNILLKDQSLKEMEQSLATSFNTFHAVIEKYDKDIKTIEEKLFNLESKNSSEINLLN